MTFDPDEFDIRRYELGMAIYKQSEYALWELQRVRQTYKELLEARDVVAGSDVPTDQPIQCTEDNDE